MANKLYDKGRNYFARGDLNWKSGGDTFRAFLLDSASYTPDLVNDEFLSDVPAGARKGGTGGATGYADGIAIAPADPVAGICDAPDIIFPSVAAGGPYEYILIYKPGTADADSILVVLIDDATGLPVTASGSDIQVTWDAGANKIFKL